MGSDPLHIQIPLDRYRAIIGAMGTERDAWSESFWLRIAAHAAVQSPEPVEQLAQRIRDIAGALRESTEWYRTLASPVRFVVAALLIQHHIHVADFLGECARTRELFQEAGLRHGGFAETMAVLVLRQGHGPRQVTLIEVDRIKAIYQRMKGFHWWLTGIHDLPACAALSLCPGSAEVVTAHAEDAFQELSIGRVLKGRHLQTAANLLPVTGLNLAEAMVRYRALVAILQNREDHIAEDCYEALIVLILLEQPAEVIIMRQRAIQNELDLIQGELAGTANFLIAADLCFLDLVRYDRNQQPISAPQELAAMIRTLHTFHLIATVLVSQIEPQPLDPAPSFGGQFWPFPST